MQITRIVNSVFNSNSYILSDDNYPYCWLVDVGDVNAIIEFIGNREVKGVFLTHTHYDHIYGINKLIEQFPETIVYTSIYGKEGLLSDKLNFSRYHLDPIIFRGEHIKILEEGNVIFLFPFVELKVMYTPGHDWSCMCYYTDKFIFTGDSYIPNIKVITSMPKSNKEQAKESLSRIRELIKTRDVYPGHNDCVINSL